MHILSNKTNYVPFHWHIYNDKHRYLKKLSWFQWKYNFVAYLELLNRSIIHQSSYLSFIVQIKCNLFTIKRRLLAKY